MPNIIPTPSEIASIGLDTSPPGDRIAAPLSCTFAAPANMASGLKPKYASTITAMKVTPPSSSAALMICTQVVASMPPNST